MRRLAAPWLHLSPAHRTPERGLSLVKINLIPAMTSTVARQSEISGEQICSSKPKVGGDLPGK